MSDMEHEHGPDCGCPDCGDPRSMDFQEKFDWAGYETGQLESTKPTDDVVLPKPTDDETPSRIDDD